MKWERHWMKHAELIASMSPCPRGKVGAFIIDQNNNPISAGFNGPPRKAPGTLCGGDTCTRTDQCVVSGTSTEIGCHHAEVNAIANAVNKGVSLNSCAIVISVYPCLMCAKLIHHSGINRVILPMSCNYSKDGIRYLRVIGLSVSFIPIGDMGIPY
jgi:dCMP deaminase